MVSQVASILTKRMASKRNVEFRGVGFYRIEEGSNEEVEERCLEVKEGDLVVDVLKVVRVVESL